MWGYTAPTRREALSSNITWDGIIIRENRTNLRVKESSNVLSTFNILSLGSEKRGSWSHNGRDIHLLDGADGMTSGRFPCKKTSNSNFFTKTL